MGREAGPAVSVSQNNIYITGTSEDILSGTAVYRYDPPNKTGTSNSVSNVTGKYTAPQFELTTSGIWTFYAKDTAGNSNTKQTSSITLYRCNYCNQKTVQLHYRCPTHYSSDYCHNSPGICPGPVYLCPNTPIFAWVRRESFSGPAWCYGCGNYTSPMTYWFVGCASHQNPDRGLNAPLCTNCSKVGTKILYDLRAQPSTVTCGSPVYTGCGKSYTTNYTLN